MPILTYRSSNPMRDGRQSANALMVQRGVVRHFQQNGIAMIAELTLANSMRADLVGIDGKGKIMIVEIKSSIEDFKVDQKWPEYCDYCDLFYFASHSDVPGEIFPKDQGFILADNYGAEIIRPAIEQKLTAAGRKAMTLGFARAAASRLERVTQFANSAGIEMPDEFSKQDDN